MSRERSSIAAILFDGGISLRDSATEGKDAKALMDGGIDIKKDAGTDDGNHLSCCSNYCEDGLGVYTNDNDASIDEYIDNHYGNADYPIEYYPIARLVLFCFTKGVNCEDYKIDIRTLLDTYTLQWGDPGGRMLELSSPLYFIYPKEEKLSSYIGHEIVNQDGWKVEITGASIDYWSTACEMGDVRGPDINLEGSLDNVKFVRDEQDSLPSYVVLKTLKVT